MDTTSFLESTKNIDKTNNIHQDTLSDFLKNSSIIKSADEKQAALNKTLLDFLKGNVSTNTNTDYFDERTISDYIDKQKIDKTNPNEEKTLKSILNNDITQSNPFGDVNLSSLIYYRLGQNEIDKSFLEKFLKGTSEINNPGINKKLYKQLLNSINETPGEVIKGLDSFLAQSQLLERTKIDPIKIDLEVIRTNFTIDNEDFGVQREPILSSRDYMFRINRIKNNRKKLEKVSNFLTRMPKVKSVNRSKNIVVSSEEELQYVIPEWSIAKNRRDIDMRVRQSNRFIRKASNSENAEMGGMAPFRGNDFTKGLVDILTPTTDDSWDGEKEGFHTYGASPDRVSDIRPILRAAIPNKGYPYNIELNTLFYRSIAEDKLKVFDENGYVYYNVNRGAIPFILKYVPISGIKVPSSIVSSINGGNGIGANRDSIVKEEFRHLVYNMSIKALMNRTPDFRQNMYLGLFVLTKTDDTQEKTSFYDIVNTLDNNFTDDWAIKFKRNSTDTEITKAYESFKNIVDTYYVRMEGITVPGAKLSTYEIPFLTRKVKKITSNFAESHKLTINFTLDETGALLRQFDILTGGYSYKDNEDDHNKYVSNFFPVSFNHDNKSRLDLVITYNDFRVGRRFTNGEFTRSSYLPAQQDTVYGDDYVTNGSGELFLGDKKSYRQFILEDVRILGFSGGLQFQRDSANKMSIPVDIIFKRINTVDNNIPLV